MMIIAENHFQALVSGHHPDLAVRQPLVESPCDCGTPQIMRRDFAYACVITPAPDYLPGLCRRERFIEFQRAVIYDGLEDKGLWTV